VVQSQLKVIKSDGTEEEYIHTKVIGTLSNALSNSDQADVYIAEQFADVVTYYLYHRQNRRVATSSEILSIIKAVLTETGYDNAAISLSEHHYERQIKRSRIEVVSIDNQELTDAEQFTIARESGSRSRWDKSKIANDLVQKSSFSRQTARAIAAMVEYRIFNMGLTLVPTSLIRQLVLNETAAVLRAQKQMQTV
jgi:transcriptional regulator NrdR family protein